MEITRADAPTALLSPPGTTTPPPDELREACRQFEAIFIRQMLEQSLAPLLAKPEDSPGGGGDIHRYMIADVLSENLSESGVFGIADLLQAQFQFPHNSSPRSVPHTLP